MKAMNAPALPRNALKLDHKPTPRSIMLLSNLLQIVVYPLLAGRVIE